VSARFDHACGVTATQAVYCWGTNDHGQLGDGTTTPRLVPTPVIQ
jgi:alpha-tubulin suppressor-like RCC1 family protein